MDHSDRSAVLVPCYAKEGVRAIRLHHWKLVRDLNHQMRGCEYDLERWRDWFSKRQELNRAKEKHAFHLNSVIVLNQFFEIGDTAERDAEKEMR